MVIRPEPIIIRPKHASLQGRVNTDTNFTGGNLLCKIWQVFGDKDRSKQADVSPIMDIDDILADIDRSEPTLTAADTALDHQQLTRFWISERAAPDVLRWPAELMDRVTARIRRQIETIEDLTAGIEVGSIDAGGLGGSSSGSSNLTLSILQTDLSRTQYIVRSLLRQRIAKLTKYAMYYLTLADRSELLSPQEQSFLQNHQALLSSFYSASFLSAFPAQLQRLDDNTGGLNMAEGPDGQNAVFIRCLAGRWTNDPAYEAYEDYEDDEDGRRGEPGALQMRRGQVWVVRWEDVKKGSKRVHLKCFEASFAFLVENGEIPS